MKYFEQLRTYYDVVHLAHWHSYLSGSLCLIELKLYVQDESSYETHWKESYSCAVDLNWLS